MHIPLDWDVQIGDVVEAEVDKLLDAVLAQEVLDRLRVRTGRATFSLPADPSVGPPWRSHPGVDQLAVLVRHEAVLGEGVVRLGSDCHVVARSALGRGAGPGPGAALFCPSCSCCLTRSEPPTTATTTRSRSSRRKACTSSVAAWARAPQRAIHRRPDHNVPCAAP